MAYEDAFLTSKARVFMGGKFTAGSVNEEADDVTFTSGTTTHGALQTAVQGTIGSATVNGWTEISTEGWGFVFGSYPGSTVEIVEQGGSASSTFRQSLEVEDLEWTFQIDVNKETFKIFGGVHKQKRRRWVVCPSGLEANSPVDIFEAWTNGVSQDNGGRLQYNVSVLLNGPIVTGVTAT